MKISGNRIHIKLLNKEDVGTNYVSWMGDPDVTRFLSTNSYSHSKESIMEYVEKINLSNEDYLFGIYLNDGVRHIGNIKIGTISFRHRHAELGLLIGESDCRGKGYAIEGLNLCMLFAFEYLNLNKVYAGVNEMNTSSVKLFENAGFRQCAKFIKHAFLEGKYRDSFFYEMLKSEYQGLRCD